MTDKEQDFKNEMEFLKSAFAQGKWQIERALNTIQRSIQRPEEFLNSSVYTDTIIRACHFMNEAERRTVKLYRKFHGLD